MSTNAPTRWVGWVFGVIVSSSLHAASLAPLNDVAQITAGTLHSCALDRAGTVSCWGDNTFGQLGLGEDTALSTRPTPVQVPALASIRSVSTGYAHTCAVTANRGVVCWGFNGSGQIGAGDTGYSHNVPVAVQGLPAPVKTLATGSGHSCALLEDGRVSCWGDNTRGQLGDGSTTAFRATAGLVSGLPAAGLLIAAGDEYTCVSLSSGGVQCWGANGSGQLGNNTLLDSALPTAVQGLPGPVSVVAGSATATCALSTGGALYCWGAQYPLGAFEGGSSTARLYPDFQSGFVDVDAGDFHFCALSNTGSIRCLGDNVDGQFGTGPLDGSANAQTTLDLATDVEQIAAGGHHTCARGRSGMAQCWGSNRAGQLGIDTVSLRLVPTQVTGLNGATSAISVGNRHGCSLSSAGTVKCWGYNGNGELGDGTTLTRLNAVDVVGLQPGARAVELGSESSCVINGARRVQCWGANYDGRLGNGAEQNSSVPVDVLGLGNLDALSISIGRSHTCALLSGGSVRCWGTNEFGQLGDGSTTNRPIAVQVTGLESGVAALSAGFYHTCAVTTAGAMRCWGINQSGQLGDGSNTDRLTPTPVAGLASGVSQPAAGALHTCALLTNGSVSCWGSAEFGTILGDGSTVDRNVPGEVPSLRSNVVELTAGYSNNCVRFTSGAVKCWGRNVGDNTQIARPLPTDVAGLTRDIADIDAGVGDHSCAIISGAVRCWGDNTFGQIGDGTTHGETRAMTVLTNELVRRVLPITDAANAASGTARFDATGRYVVFESDASNLVVNDNNAASDVFRQDRDTGEIVRISVDNGGTQIAGASSAASLTADAQLIAFIAPDNAVGKLFGESLSQRKARQKENSTAVFLRNLLTGSTQRIASTAMSGGSPSLAPNGGSLAFSAPVTDPTQGALGQLNQFVVPLNRAGSTVVPGVIRCISCKSINAAGTDTAGNANGESSNGVLSADGQWLAYQTSAANAVADSPSPCSVGNSQVMLRNMLTGATTRISPPNSLPASSCASVGSQSPSIDYLGQAVVVQTDQSLSTGDNNGLSDVYVWRASETEMLRVSAGGDDVDTAGAAVAPQISGDGRQVVFISTASNHDLGFPDNNDRADVHSVNLASPKTIQRLSRTSTGSEINAASAKPTLNFDGSAVAFQTTASNLASALTGGSTIYARSNPQAQAKRTATWWNPAESGWGLTVFDQGSVLAPAWFTYDTDGEPTWFLIGGAFAQADGSFRGDVLRLRGTPFDQISGPATQSVNPAGSVVMKFAGESRLQFDYTVDGFSQSKVLEKFPFGTRNFACATTPAASRKSANNYTDLWTGAGNSTGWGLTLLHVDQGLFGAWYTYDSDGEAVFFVIVSNQQSDGSFTGSIFRQRNGTPFSAINGAPPSPASDLVGTTRFVFNDGESASFSYTVGAITQTRQIARLLVGSDGQECRSTDAAGN